MKQNKREELNVEMMEQVNGGYWWFNEYPDDVFNAVGIKVNRHFLRNDEFVLPNGATVNHQAVVQYMESNYNVLEKEGGYRYIVCDKATGQRIYAR